MAKRKSNVYRVIPELAYEALRQAKGNRNAAYTHYVKLHYQLTGSLNTGFNANDLQEFYDQKGGDKG